MVYDENESWYLDDNIETYLGKDPEFFEADDDFQESNLMHGKKNWRQGSHLKLP